MIKAETSIRYVRSNPGFKNYSKLVRYARIGITRPLSILMFSSLIFITYSIALILFLVTVASATAACLILSAFIYEALRIPADYIAEIAGTISFGIFFSGLMILTAYGFYVLCRPLLRLSANLISKMMKKNKKQMFSSDTDAGNYAPEHKVKPSSKALKAGLIIIAAGFLIGLATGLPVKLFMIFNSMKPVSITMHTQEFTASEATKISIYTAHSTIRLKEGNSNKIKLDYEQSDWLDYNMSCSGGELVFKERSNGRLPLFSLVTMHENRAELTVTLPEGYQPEDVNLESRGGFIYIENIDIPAEVKTYTGSIYLENLNKPAASGQGSVSTRTLSGVIQAGGKNVGTRTANGIEYELQTESTANIVLETERGNVYID